MAAWSKSANRVCKILDWCLDHNQEDRRVDVGCRTCKESASLLASTARVSWLAPFHHDHEVWIRNPFNRGRK